MAIDEDRIQTGIGFDVDERIKHDNAILQRRRDGIFFSAFIDPGGTLDDYFLTVLRTDIKINLISIMGAEHWKLNEKMGIDFAKIRNDIATIHDKIRFDVIGCEFNNYGREQVQAFKREHHMNLYGINTTGKITSEETIRAGISMDKHQMVKWVNEWRQHKYEGPTPTNKIVLPKELTPGLRKIVNQLDTFIVKRQKGTGNFVYEAEGTKHDDGVMSLLGNCFIIKNKILNRGGAFVGGPTHRRESVSSLESVLAQINADVQPPMRGIKSRFGRRL